MLWYALEVWAAWVVTVAFSTASWWVMMGGDWKNTAMVVGTLFVPIMLLEFDSKLRPVKQEKA